MNTAFAPTCDKKGCDNESTHVRYLIGAKGHIKQVYYCNDHKKDGDVIIIADLEQRRIDNRRKTAQQPNAGIVGSRLPMGDVPVIKSVTLDS